MTMTVGVTGRRTFELEYLLLDQNGTLSNRGKLIEGVASRLRALGDQLSVHVLSGDSFGTLDAVLAELGVAGRAVGTGSEKRAFVDQLGGDRCVAIGNGYNDVEMFESCALGIAVHGPEGLSTSALLASQIVCTTINEALDLLLDPRALAATLRA